MMKYISVSEYTCVNLLLDKPLYFNTGSVKTNLGVFACSVGFVWAGVKAKQLGRDRLSPLPRGLWQGAFVL